MESCTSVPVSGSSGVASNFQAWMQLWTGPLVRAEHLY